MSAPELKPCPFCGGEAHIKPSHNYTRYIGCSNEECECYNMIRFYDDLDSFENAITAWNTRFPDPEITALNVEVERLVKAIQGCESYINSRANNRTCDVSNHEQMAMKNLLNVFTQAQAALEGSHET